MALTTMLTTLSVLALWVTAAVAYSGGAPDNDEAICKSMRPGHRVNEQPTGALIDPQSGTPWFQITVSKNENVEAGEELDVTIVTTAENKYIEGFFIQARTSDESMAMKDEAERHGTWMLTDDTTQRLRCNNQAVTHYNVHADGHHTHWDNVTLKWKAPTGTNMQNVAFWATVVKNYREFFMFVRSPILNASGAPHLVAPSIFLLVITSVLALFK